MDYRLLMGGAVAAVASLAATPTYHKDIEPLLQRECQECHRAGEIGPFSLMTYAEARPWAKAIKSAVASKKMPPWFADEGKHAFANKRSLSQAEIESISAWADGGAPEGNAKDAPKARTFQAGWQLKPDIVVEMPKAFELPATGTVNYKYVLVKTNFEKDMWISQAEMRPGNNAVLHHGKVWVRPPGSRWMERAVPGEAYERETQAQFLGTNDISEGNDILGKFNPGLGAQNFAVEGAAKFVPKGADLIFELHYTSTGKPEKDASKLGLVLAKEPPKVRYALMSGPTASNLVIPPGDGNAEVVSEVTMASDTKLAYVQPHMHLRGKDFELRAIYPSGETDVLFHGKFDFNWQQGFTFEKPVVLPKGTRLIGISHFDNSANNKWNPDPAKEVRWGPQNWDEMSNAFVGFIFDVDTPLSALYKASGPSLRRAQPGIGGPTLASLLQR